VLFCRMAAPPDTVTIDRLASAAHHVPPTASPVHL
jgi:hypothetical protein